MVIENYLRGKYTGGSPDGDRFKDVRGEYHASNVANCPRDWYWNFKRDGDDDWSPYFEIGRMYEVMYGSALIWEYADVTEEQLKTMKPWELIEEAERVKQDVGITIHIDDEIEITGESDWVVFRESGNYDIDHVVYDKRTDERHAIADGEKVEYDTDILKVIETKTTKKIEWREKYGHKKPHQYQLASYMWAMDTMGEIAYMTRNEWDEMVFDFTRDPQIEQDMEIRVKRHHQNLTNETPPDTDPIVERQCKYCSWREECKMVGGSVWD